MKILNFEIKRSKGAEGVNDITQVKFLAELIESDLKSYDVLTNISKMVADKLAVELYADIKEELLSDSGMNKIIQEIRLNLAKKVID